VLVFPTSRETTKRRSVAEESEERYRTLFDTMLEGFCIIEVLFDMRQIRRLRFIEIIAAFEPRRACGCPRQAHARLAPEVTSPHWFELTEVLL